MKNNYYITTPIYYPSAKPHMGHAYSSIIADFFARFKRIQGFNVFYLTGTDEHGQKIERAAKDQNKDPLTFCDEISKTFKNLTTTLNLAKLRQVSKRPSVSIVGDKSRIACICFFAFALCTPENIGSIYIKSKFIFWD